MPIVQSDIAKVSLEADVEVAPALLQALKDQFPNFVLVRRNEVPDLTVEAC